MTHCTTLFVGLDVRLARNSHTRRILVEGAWAYRYPAGAGIFSILGYCPRSIAGLGTRREHLNGLEGLFRKEYNLSTSK